MSAFFLGRYWRSGAVDRAPAERWAACLGGGVIGEPGFGLAAASQGAVITQRGFEGSDDLLLLDGGLSGDCRADLRHRLGLAQASDARLIARAFALWGIDAAKRLDGRFALALVDRRRECVWLLRDPLGECTLFFAEQEGRLSVSTSVNALIIAAGLPREENAPAIARYFALQAPAPGETYWRGVQSVEAGACLWFTKDRKRSRRRTLALAQTALRFQSEIEATTAWRELLGAACARAIGAARRPAVLLSGGIDSTALATLAAELRPDLLAVSWCLPGFPDADESAWVAATADHLSIELKQTKAGTDWPLARVGEWAVDPDGPWVNPYRHLQDGVLREASAAGVDVILSGNFGDHLYPDVDPTGSPRAELRGQIRRRLECYPRLFAGLRRALGRASALPHWLLPDWQQQLAGSVWAGSALLSPESIHDASLGRSYAARRGLDLRYVYRDPEVIAFMRALPAHWSLRQHRQKWITREILRGSIKESVRLRPKAGSLESYFRFAICEREAKTVSSLLNDKAARWPEFVQEEMLFGALSDPRDESDLLLLWLAISYELWWRAHRGLGPAVLAFPASQSA